MARRPFTGEGKYTWEDYRSWPDEERWEVIGGVAYALGAAPSTWHQWILHRLSHHFTRRLEGRDCVHYIAPIDVRLSDEDIVQPDLVVVCDRSQIKPTHLEGPPALVVEILSPSTLTHDLSLKMNLYAMRGVREYWTVQVHPALVEVFVLEGDGYRIAAAYDATGMLSSPTRAGLEIDLRQVFDFPVDPPGIQLIKEQQAPYGQS